MWWGSDVESGMVVHGGLPKQDLSGCIVGFGCGKRNGGRRTIANPISFEVMWGSDVESGMVVDERLPIRDLSGFIEKGHYRDEALECNS